MYQYLLSARPYSQIPAWLPGEQAANLSYAVPEFWNGQQLTWSVIARINGQTYSLFGVPFPGAGVKPASLQSAEYTSTHTTFTVAAGEVTFILDFMSPVSPLDYVRQSMPFSYLTVSATPTNGHSPKVEIYSDIDNSWAGQFGYEIAIDWDWTFSDQSTQIFTLTPQNTAMYSEVNDMAQWGSAVYSTKPYGTNVTARVGDLQTVRANFAANGSLDADPWSWSVGSVVAYSHDLGMVSETANVTFAIGYWRQAAVNYLGSARTAYFTSTCDNINCGCVHALDDFDAADAESLEMDAMISQKANSVAGTNYSDIVTLSVRQAFGGLDITIPGSSLDTNDVMIFLKEISSDGNANTIDVILPLSPILYLMAPDYIRLLLEPIMQYVASGAWPHKYAVHDIGSSYPSATGHNDGDAEQMPLEECGDVLILAYMYLRATGDSNWWQQYDALWKQYADYLAAKGLYEKSQLDSDDGLGTLANQTGLVVKAAIALNAYGMMSGQANYSDIGKQFAATLYKGGAGLDSRRTHFTLQQGDDKFWGMEYNFYLDVLLNLSTFPASAYALQTAYYLTVRQPAGVPLDSSVDWGKTDWMMFAAGTAMAPEAVNGQVRNMLIDDVHAFISNEQCAVPFSDKYFVGNDGSGALGTWDTYLARPVVGGHFALMGLDRPTILGHR